MALHDEATVLMAGGALKNKRGQVHVTNDRLFFTDQRFNPSLAGGVGGVLAGTLAEQLEKLRREHPPMVDVPLTDITRVSRVTKLTVRDILVIQTRSDETRFASGFKVLGPLLRRVITERHGRSVVDDGPDAWRVAS